MAYEVKSLLPQANKLHRDDFKLLWLNSVYIVCLKSISLT